MRTEHAFAFLIALTLFSVAPSQAQIFVPTEDGAALQAESSTTAGASWGDYDGDGDLDVAVTDIYSGTQLFRNDGDGVFQLTNELGVVGNAYGSAWADLNNDGDLDLIVHSLGFGTTAYINEGGGNFIPVGTTLGSVSDVRDINLVDFDVDGMIDVFMARRFGFANELLLNKGDYVFENFEGFPGDSDDSVSGAWGDYDLDGDLDLYVANTSGQPDRFYHNVANSLVPVTLPLEQEVSSHSANWVDYDHDGDLDLYVANASGSDLLYRNEDTTTEGVTDLVPVAAGSITEEATASHGSVWGDVDNDGDVDLVVSNRVGTTTLHINDGTGNFESQVIGEEGYGFSATLIDYDNDGDLDLFVTRGGANFSEGNQLYENTTDGAGNWLQIRCIGTVSNAAAIGTQIHIKSTIDGVARWQVREIQGRSGRTGQSGLRVHFGLADTAIVDMVIVRWPSGERQVVEDVSPNQVLTIVEDGEGRIITDNEGTGEGIDLLNVESIYPNPFAGGTSIRIAVEQASPVSVAIYDVLGRRVRTLIDREVRSGYLDLTWDTRDEQGTKLSSGTYFVRVAGADRQSTAAITLVR